MCQDVQVSCNSKHTWSTKIEINMRMTRLGLRNYSPSVSEEPCHNSYLIINLELSDTLMRIRHSSRTHGLENALLQLEQHADCRCAVCSA